MRAASLTTAEVISIGSSVVGTDAHRAGGRRAGADHGRGRDRERHAHGRRRPERRWLHERIAAAGAVRRRVPVVRDEPDEVRAAVDELVAGARVVVVNGGTGISRRDTTYDTLAAMLEKPLPGFGELFRMLSWEQVGAAAMLSRATAGTYRGGVVVSVPGSPKAVAARLGERLIEPELAHLAWEVGKVVCPSPGGRRRSPPSELRASPTRRVVARDEGAERIYPVDALRADRRGEDARDGGCEPPSGRDVAPDHEREAPPAWATRPSHVG